ncbi:cell division protein FtsX [Minwuia sp.]|uniref:cell division protein FtsX n=1 Tax=Minwuia sp. TaxID=2493630 RepID=UPI003A8DF929
MKASALALDRDPSSRFLPWIVAALALIVTIAVGVSFSLAALTGSWGAIGSDRVSVRIAAADDGTDQVAADVLTALRDSPSVRTARLLERSEVADLLSPWLGDAGQTGSGERDLPLPLIIDVQLTGAAAQRDIGRLISRYPDAVLDSTRGWLEPLRQLARLSGFVAGGLATLSIAVIVLITMFATRAALMAHDRTIELLRLMGADEAFIAQRFQLHGLKQGLLGGIAGTIPGLVTVGIGVAAARLDGSDLLTGLTPTLPGWLAMALLPVLIAIVAMLTARLTVLDLLRTRW